MLSSPRSNSMMRFVLRLTTVLISITSAQDASIFDSVTNRPGGVVCNDNSQCYSKICYVEGYCAPDAPQEGTTTGGSHCNVNADCFSGYCVEKICAPDSPAKGRVVAGGPCIRHDQCYSGYCNLRNCGPDSELKGKLAAGGECEYHSQCYSTYCHRAEGASGAMRCAPDGREEGKAPGGGYCRLDSQCASGSCHSRCAPESPKERGKTADGGSCRNHSYCEKGHRCYLEMCTIEIEHDNHDPKGYQNARTTDIDAPKSKKLPSGARCRKSAECQSAFCIYERCAPPAQYDANKIADGGICNEQIQDGQCQSGQCRDHLCTVSFPGRSTLSAGAAGSPCASSQFCYSGVCANNKCSSDSPTPPPEVQLTHRNRYQVAAGGLCVENEDCYSGYCENKRCGADGPRRGTLASGASCKGDEQCYSKYCYNNRCAPSAGGDQEGKVAAGGRCLGDHMCPVGCSCVHGHCHLDRVVYGSNMRDLYRPMLATLRVNETCWHNAQCAKGRCLDRKCTVRWQGDLDSAATSVRISWVLGNAMVLCMILVVLV